MTPTLVKEHSPLPVEGATIAGGSVSATILVVEDDDRSARMLSANLSAAGHRILLANSGEQAEQLVLDDPPDLILCDVCLPGIDGIEFTRNLRARSATQAIPILLVTSLDDRKVLTRGLGAGADDFLTKPVNSVELRSRVHSLLRNKILAEELRAHEAAATPFIAPASSRELPSPLAPSQQLVHQNPSTPARILLVEDNQQEARLIDACLQEVKFELHVASTVEAASRILEEREWDLIVVDLILPDGNGYALIEQIKRNARHARTPILVVSAMVDIQDRVKALELGADDFVLKGFDRLEFEARVRRLLRMKQSLDQLADRCHQAIKQATTDGLTGLFTHGFLQDTLQQHVAYARRYTSPLSLLFIDIDHFKRINDRYGHAAGDDVLRGLAETIRATIRHSDIGVRYGGEEFVVLMPHTTRADAESLAERLRCGVEGMEIANASIAANLRVTISSGIASFPDDASDAAGLLEHADEAMYLAKQAGRNQVAVFGSARRAIDAQPTVLIVDDDDRNLRLLEAYLKPDNYLLLRAGDGAEAIEIARRQHPDLILLDGMMPRLTGFDACRRLKQESGTNLIPIVLVTALNSREDRLRAIEAGADDFLSKPIDKVELLTRIRALLRAKRNTDLLEDAETVIFALARAVENRDSSTGDHVERVSRYAVALGEALGMTELQLDGLRKAGVVHDIGKVAIPDAILLKPEPFTAEERRIMQSHTEVGYEILRPMRTFGESLPAVRFHHERLNGSGYPLGLRGNQIPLVAQIIGIVDVYDALTSDRVYRKALNSEETLDILDQEVTKGFHDPELVLAFRTVIQSATHDSHAVAR